MPFLVFKSTGDFPPLAALKFIIGNKTAVSILTLTEAPRKTVTVLVDGQEGPLRVSSKVQVNGSARNVKVFLTHLGPGVVQKVHALCDYTAWCDVAAQPVPELSQQAKRRLEAPTVRIVGPRPPQPASQQLPNVSDIRMPSQRRCWWGDPEPHALSDGKATVPKGFRVQAISALLRLTHPSWEDADLICKEVELCIAVRTAGMGHEYIKVVNDAVSKFQSSHLVPYLTLSTDFLMRTKQRTVFKEPFFASSLTVADSVESRRRLLANLASELQDARLAWEAEKLGRFRPEWRVFLARVRRGQPLAISLLDMPRGIVEKMKAALGTQTALGPQADDEVEVTGEKTWAERDRELRAAAVVLE
jgi:hypothetical protein